MNLLELLFGMTPKTATGDSSQEPRLDFGLFFFNSNDPRISSDYGMIAKRSVCLHVAEREPLVRSSAWKILSGDLLSSRNIQMLLTTTSLKPDSTRLNAEMRQAFEVGQRTGYIIYLIGMFDCPPHGMRSMDRDPARPHRRPHGRSSGSASEWTPQPCGGSSFRPRVPQNTKALV